LNATDLEAALGYAFRDPALAELALSHPSYSNELDGSRGNERLEFLGDAVLGLVVARLLYEAHPDWHEGDLTRARAALVNGSSLARRALALGLDALVKLGRTERRSGGEPKQGILANCFEAVLGAVYLDGGIGPVVDLARRAFGEDLSAAGPRPPRDPKTELQEWAHAAFQKTPRYRTVGDSGGEEDEERFTVEVALGEEVLGRGVGRSKRSAERAAAAAALARREP
jgi:ribonuclease-3